jgi:hypothetical protein
LRISKKHRYISTKLGEAPQEKGPKAYRNFYFSIIGPI